MKVFVVPKIKKSTLVNFFIVEKVGGLFVLLFLYLLSILSLFTILFNNFQMVDRAIELILSIKMSCLAILFKL